MFCICLPPFSISFWSSQLTHEALLGEMQPGDVEPFMRRLVTELLPRWLQEPWALEAQRFRLSLARECFETCHVRDVEGAV